MDITPGVVEYTLIDSLELVCDLKYNLILQVATSLGLQHEDNPGKHIKDCMVTCQVG